MKEKEKPLLSESSTISSRRELMHLTAVSLCFASLFFSTSAEAHPRNASIKQKIMEKFDELKQKVGLSKPRDEAEGSKSKDNEAKKSKPTNGNKVKSKDDLEGRNPGNTSQQTPAQIPEKEPHVPMIPTLPPLNILTGGTVETSVS